MRQTQALQVMMSGANVFLTGAPGAGKTYVLNEFVNRSVQAGKKVAITASTGIAASHLGGNTIHSWSGLGIIDDLSESDMQRLSSSDKLLKRYNSTDVLVIDEVSMLHGQRLDLINRLAKVLRSNQAPFGGLQVVLVGDLFQLPPVSRNSSVFDFVHLSNAWRELNPQICYLTEQHRQEDNDGLLLFLEGMRRSELSDDQFEIIKERLAISPEIDQVVTRLYSHNVDVDVINERHLSELTGISKTYVMKTKGSKLKLEQLVRGLLVPELLELKLDAEVMFVANNFGAGFVNGSRGRVIDFKHDLPVVQLLKGRVIVVEPHIWTLTEDGSVRAEVSQLPLRLAWAITIHKSQGMSLDAAEIDLSKAFTPGMGYVALSRVRSLDGLYLKGLNNMALNMHQEIYELDRQLLSESSRLAAVTPDVAEQPLKARPQNLSVDAELLNLLKTWRLKRAATDRLPAYIIAHDSALEAVATTKPLSSSQLLALPGFGVTKVDKYGGDILSIVAAHEAA